ncbi:hypothetical protein DD559_00495 [Sphingomonas pokkalii]|uniref:Transmembrane protein n=2 Tax=Sphingomonas pokkalii TaxID=2175090 RepID=A0A2U0S9K1_9SPHN|nr:hypothetical protein DD559_00495 [Sphingomonas pokkalii]
MARASTSQGIGSTREIDFTNAEEVRAQRVPFVRTPLVPAARSLIDRLRNFFARRASPFRASAIAFAIDQAEGLSKSVGAGDKRVSLAPGSTTLVSLQVQLESYAGSAFHRAEEALSGLDTSIAQESQWLNQCRPKGIIDMMSAHLDRTTEEHKEAILASASNLKSAKDELTVFRKNHGLSDDVKPGKKIDMAVIGQLGILTVGEFVINSLYQSTQLQNGLVGGFSAALLASGVFILCGIGLGVGRQLRLKQDRGRWGGYALIAAALLVAGWAISLLSLARVAGAHGDTDPYGTAQRQIWHFGAILNALSDFTAFSFALISFAVIFLISWKFLTYSGGYLGLRSRGAKIDAAEPDLREKITQAKDHIKKFSDDFDHWLDEGPAVITACKSSIRALAATGDKVVTQFLSDSQDIEHAARLFDAYVRQNGGANIGELWVNIDKKLKEHLAQIRSKHATLVGDAETLCKREDIDDDSIAGARKAFAAKLAVASKELAKAEAAPERAQPTGSNPSVGDGIVTSKMKAPHARTAASV